MENRDSFVFYRSFYESLKKLKINDRVKIYDAICELALNQNESELDGVPYAIFTLIKPQIVANNKKYLNGCKPKNKKADTKKSASEQEKNVSKSEANSKQTVSKSEGNVNVECRMNNVNDNVNENIPSNLDSSINTKTADLIAKEFKRELTKEEHSQVIAMCKFYGPKLVEYALRECIIYEQLNFGYLVQILKRWRADGMTAEKYEAGQT